MRPLVRIPQSGGDDTAQGVVHISREHELSPCCGLHQRHAGHWQVDIAAQPTCKKCLHIHARFVGTFTPPLPGF